MMLDIHTFQRIVVKVGTSTLVHETGRLNLRRIDELCRTLSDLKNAGRDVILVSSGAIGVGTYKLGLKERPRDVQRKQAAAAVGQCELMHLYDKSFSEYGNTVAQMLLTKDILEIPERLRHAQNALNAIFEYGAIPIINENDSVAVDEIEIGDNDTLSAYVARLCRADLLVLLSDIDGLYDKAPSDDSARLIPLVTHLDEDILAMAGGAGTAVGTGGMQTKLAAAQIAMDAGIHMVIANGERPSILYDILEGRIRGTLFRAGESAIPDTKEGLQ